MLIPRLHDNYVHRRRVSVLRDHIAGLLPHNTTVLDVGCGDGLLSRSIMESRPDVAIAGLDVLTRAETHIPVQAFDGEVLPYDDRSFDFVMFVDVLHHTHHAMRLLKEAARVGRKGIVIKDHTCEGSFDRLILRLMDYVGNAHHGVALPYDYWSRDKWSDAFAQLRVKADNWKNDLKLYPRIAGWLFDRSLHFVVRLDLGVKSRPSHDNGI
jgi:SAM-dependent methyltransferase